MNTRNILNLKKSVLLVILTTTVLLAGCAPMCMTIIPSISHSGSHRFGNGMRGDISASNPESRQYNGFLQAKTTFSNKTSESQNFKYRFVWFDQANYKTGDSTAWTPVQLAPNMHKQITAIAPKSTATNFNVQVCKIG